MVSRDCDKVTQEIGISQIDKIYICYHDLQAGVDFQSGVQSKQKSININLFLCLN